MKTKHSAIPYLLCVLFAVPVAWFALMVAQSFERGIALQAFLDRLQDAVTHPIPPRIDMPPAQHTPIFVGVGLLLYVLAIAYAASSANHMRGVEHGSARWGNAGAVNRNLKGGGDVLLTQHVRMGLNTRQHNRNLNTLVIGGSGSGKTRNYVKPNVMQANTSYVLTDPKGEILRATGGMLKKRGYDIKVLNLVELFASDAYNPFVYIRDENDVLILANNIMRNTTPRTARSGDPFWEKAETTLLVAMIFFVLNLAPENEQNFGVVLDMIGKLDIDEEHPENLCIIDVLYQEYEANHPGDIGYRYYNVFRQAAGKTARSIIIGLSVRLAIFQLDQVRGITSKDEMHIGQIGKRLTALFVVTSDTDPSFNFVAGMLYTQIFQRLYAIADEQFGGALPVPVRLIFDEFANVALPEDFERAIATARSRNISISVILQNLAQLKALYRDTWETIVGNTDSILYLGGNEQSTHDFMAKMLGKATIDVQTRGYTRGRNGSSSTNSQKTGRDLLTPDEVRMLPTKEAILLVRGELPVMDRKYEIRRHPRYGQTADSGKPGYVHKTPMRTILARNISDVFGMDQVQQLDMVAEENNAPAMRRPVENNERVRRS